MCRRERSIDRKKIKFKRIITPSFTNVNMKSYPDIRKILMTNALNDILADADSDFIKAVNKSLKNGYGPRHIRKKR